MFQYKCDNFYAPESEGALFWNDPALGIDWRLSPEDVILSEKDKCHPLLSQIDSPFVWGEDLYPEISK